jgi:hypothetical protein
MANFTFVTHKGARPEKSELVKAHVMRESQRRRREARQKAHSTLTVKFVYERNAHLVQPNGNLLRQESWRTVLSQPPPLYGLSRLEGLVTLKMIQAHRFFRGLLQKNVLTSLIQMNPPALSTTNSLKTSLVPCQAKLTILLTIPRGCFRNTRICCTPHHKAITILQLHCT